MSQVLTTRKHLFRSYQFVTICVGVLIYVFSAAMLDLRRVDLRLATLVVLALCLGSRISVRIPRFCSQISVSDTFIFLTLLMYGAEYAVLLAATEAFVSSYRLNRKIRTDLFNFGCAAVSTFITAQVLTLAFGNIISLQRSASPLTFVAALSALAISQYVVNSGLVAVGAAVKTGQRVWQTWKNHYLWTSITYLAGASTAGLVVKLVDVVGFYALILTAPIVAIIFFTYRTYLKNVESSAAQAEQAQRHVRELSHYIAEQERIQEQFSQVEKLSALGELASGVAHDFNNTLAGILGRAQLLLRTDDPEKIKRGLNIIIKTAEDGAKTVKRIQDFARQRRDKDFSLVTVEQLLLDVSELTRPRWKNKSEAANVHISLDLKVHSKSKVMGDESELREVLINMVFNAIDAMPEGGKLTLSALDVGNSVEISVADTGVGMSPEVRSRIFDPFFTTKGTAGLGLGLAVSFGIIRRHEATIEVESETGSGTTFRIVLPAVNQTEIIPEGWVETETRELAETSAQSAPPKEDKPRILVVDDEDYVRDLLREILESEGCSVHLAEDGPRALALLDAQPFDAVFTDVGMPGMSGWEVAQAVRQRNELIPIAVITGWGEAVGSNEQKNAGVNWVVTKPFTAERIGELAREIRNQRGLSGNAQTLATVAA
ncbi:MAG TPA: response regulator [Pyrinomonadaceae bacterium]|nr:response regulator [Pyrinomonadaceae bacterium]